MHKKFERLKTLLHSIDPSIELSAEDKGTFLLVYGPFPSFLIKFTEHEEAFLIHVNADAPTLVFYMDAIMREFPKMRNDGPFAVDADTSSIVLGADAYVKKDENIIIFGMELMEKKKQEIAEQVEKTLYIPEPKKIVFA